MYIIIENIINIFIKTYNIIWELWKNWITIEIYYLFFIMYLNVNKKYIWVKAWQSAQQIESHTRIAYDVRPTCLAFIFFKGLSNMSST
jgi:hypothetical protein